METKFEAHLIFPLDVWSQPEYERLAKYCGSVEDVEQNFEIEFSCGDDKYLSDLEGEELEKYDGKVCTETCPRLNAIKMSMVPEQMRAHKMYRFTVKYSAKTEKEIYYINGKERSQKWVG